MDDWVVIVGVSSLVSGGLFGLVCLMLSSRRELSRGTAFALGFFLGPIGLAIVFLHRIPHGERSPAFSGEPDLADDRYQLYLTRKYRVEKNGALSKIASGDRLFDSVDDALVYADEQEREARDHQRRREREAIASRRRNLRFAGITVMAIIVGIAGAALFSSVQGWRADRIDEKERDRLWQERESREAMEKQEAIAFLADADIKFPATVAATLTRRAALDVTSSCREVLPSAGRKERVFRYWVSGDPSDLHQNTSDLRLAALDLARSLEASGYHLAAQEDVGRVISRSIYTRDDVRVLISVGRWPDGDSLTICAGRFP